MKRSILAAAVLAGLTSSLAVAAPVTFDQTCKFTGPYVHADLNGETIGFDLTECTGPNSAGTTSHLMFELRADVNGVAQQQGARQLDLIAQYAFYRAIQDHRVHLKLDYAEAYVNGTSVTVRLPVQANGLDLLPTP